MSRLRPSLGQHVTWNGTQVKTKIRTKARWEQIWGMELNWGRDCHLNPVKGIRGHTVFHIRQTQCNISLIWHVLYFVAVKPSCLRTKIPNQLVTKYQNPKAQRWNKLNIQKNQTTTTIISWKQYCHCDLILNFIQRSNIFLGRVFLIIGLGWLVIQQLQQRHVL